MNQRDYETAIEREVEEWPSVSVTFESGGKHPRAVFMFGGVSRFLPYPGTPSDRRGLDMKVTQIRRELAAMGAVRNERRKSTRPPARPNPGADNSLPIGSEPAPVIPDPWAELRGIERGPLITAPGFYPNVTPNQYFAEPCPAPALTNSGISTLLKYCPAKFAYGHPAIGQPEEERASTAAQYMGRLVHRLALDKGDDYAISPHDEYRSKEAKAWKLETEEAGVMPVKQSQFDEAVEMAETIRQAIDAELQGAPYQTEVVIVWKRKGRWCRAMLDVWCPSLCRALDVKTCVSADDLAVDRAFAHGYGRQEAWYLDGLSAILPIGRPAFDFLFVEKEAPWLGRSVSSTEAMRHGSTLEIDRAFATFDACLTAGEWPGYAPRRVFPTSWQLREWTEAEFLEEAA